ncbi:hypothetical protein [Dokdonella sp.]|uniref:hypothetical protein n=1 Tax=Dokdonella sp. TaxID=2291710 RepID=UPI0035281728
MTVSDAATTAAPTLLTDTWGAGLTFGTLTAPVVGSCTTGQVCTPPTGTARRVPTAFETPRRG